LGMAFGAQSCAFRPCFLAEKVYNRGTRNLSNEEFFNAGKN
jgi:hypothetical protein